MIAYQMYQVQLIIITSRMHMVPHHRYTKQNHRHNLIVQAMITYRRSYHY
jgi:hypothetical protein